MPVTIAGMDLVPSAHVRCVWQLGPTSTASTGAVPDSPPANKTYPPPASPPASPASCDAHGRRLQIGYTGDAYDPLRKMASEIATWQKHYDASVTPPLSMNTTAVVCMAPSASGADNATVAVDFGNGDTLPPPSATSLVYHYQATDPVVCRAVRRFMARWYTDHHLRGLSQARSYHRTVGNTPRYRLHSRLSCTSSHPRVALATAPSRAGQTYRSLCPPFGMGAIARSARLPVAPAFVSRSKRWPTVHALFGLCVTDRRRRLGASLDGGPTALPAWEHVDPVLSSVALSGPRASTTVLTALAAASGPSRRDRRDAIFVSYRAMAVQPLLAINATGNYVARPVPPCPGCDQQSELSGADCCGLSVTLEVSVSTNGREW